MTEITYEQHDFAVPVLPGARIAGHIFRPPAPAARWQVLMHGGTYDHRYWDAPAIDGIPYSYAREMAGRGYSVLAVDQLGAGRAPGRRATRYRWRSRRPGWPR
jgi:alpha-beta hydrolase superfamily lysophospholipase